MPRLQHITPRYRYHRASGQAAVTLDGRDFYLGPWRSKASRTEYDRLIGEWLANGRRLPRAGATDGLTVVELLAAYRSHAQAYYRKNGRPTSTVVSLDYAIRPLKQFYGRELVCDFGPLALQALQGHLARGYVGAKGEHVEGLARRTVNDRIAAIKRGLGPAVIDDWRKLPPEFCGRARGELSYGAMSEVTEILCAMEQGDTAASHQLLPLVYNELRTLAAQRLALSKLGKTPQPTSLVHEAYLRLVDVDKEQRWNGRGHFFAAAAEAMRRILVEDARRRSSLKRGGQWHQIDQVDQAEAAQDANIVELNDALTRLAAVNPRAAQVVELHHFAGLSHELVAETLGITVYQARQKWTYARAWLQNAMLR